MCTLESVFHLTTDEELIFLRTISVLALSSLFIKLLLNRICSSSSPSSRFSPSSSSSSLPSSSWQTTSIEASTSDSSSSSSSQNPFNYPHIAISETLVAGFKWLEPSEIKCHEEYIEIRHSALFNYLNSIDSPVIVPCIILCASSLTIIDGHHRFSVMKKLGWQRIPVLLLNYQHSDIITHPLRPISKRDVVQAGITQTYLPPKSTQHMVRDLNGGWHPIACLSLMVEYKPFDHLDTSQQKQIEVDQNE